MSSNMKTRPVPPDTELFYTQDSLGFVRNLVSDIEHEIKARAKGLILEDGRNTITQDDMRRAAAEILGWAAEDETQVEQPETDHA